MHGEGLVGHYTRPRAAFVAAILAAFFVVVTAAPANARSGPPDSREVKLLLKGERFADRAAAFRAYWALVCEVAAAHEIKVKTRYKGFREKRRRIAFLDTADHAIRGAGYSLRQRVDVKDGELDDESEFALKFRSRDLAVARAADTSAHRLRADTELEEDVALDASASDGLRRIYALRTKFDSDEQAPATLGAAGRWFPALARLDLSPATPLTVVGGAIDERRVKPGKLKFGGGIKAKADITLWLDERGTPLIAEFSFDHDIDDFRDQPRAATARLFAFYRALRERSREWLADGTTKTAFTYGRSRK